MSASRALPINVDDADNLRRFIEQMSGRSSTAGPTIVQGEAQPAIQSNAHGESTDSDRDLCEASTNSSPATAEAQPAVAAYEMQSPMTRGVVAPPPTPDTSTATNEGEEAERDHGDFLQGISGLSLGDSKYAPKKGSPQLSVHRTRPTGILVAHPSLSSRLSPEQRKARDMSFARMSFVTSEQPSLRSPMHIPKVQDQATAESKNHHAATLSYANSSTAFNFDGTATGIPEESEKSCDVDTPKPNDVEEKISDVDIPAVTLAGDTKEAEEMTSVTVEAATKFPSTFMDKWIQTSKNKPVSKPANVSAWEEVKEPAASEDGLKVPVVSHQITPPYMRTPKKPDIVEETSKASFGGQSVLPPHRRAIAKPFTPIAAEPNIKVKDEPLEDFQVVSSQSTTPITPLVTPRAMAPTDEVGDVHQAEAQYAATGAPKVHHGYSPSRGTLAARAAKTEEMLKHAVRFQSWPKAQGRDQAVARARKVTLLGLPPASSVQFVTSLIHSGPLEEIRLAGPTTAFVLFLDPTDAANFYNATANGIDCHKEGAKYVVLTEMNPGDVDVVGGKLRQWIDTGMTRCVRVVGVAGEWTVGRLYVLAEGKNRKVEAIEDGVNPGGLRSVVFRFCKIDHAVEFKAVISRSDDWEHCNIHFAPDRCANSAKAAPAA